ncbi:MAG: carotenoid biosynthesis protein [Fimbriimonadaceae bacterium]|jgi:putative membrane protein|nr:carotenoid biosynthesis protein [Fimbriimonadaceae bacterium]
MGKFQFNLSLFPAGRSIYLGWFIGLIIFSMVGTTITQLTRLSPGPIPQIVGALTIMLGVCVVLHSLANLVGWTVAGRAGLLVLATGTFFELLGLYTSFPFGRYVYTGNWWPSISIPESHTFPVLLPFAWFLIAGGSFLALRRFLPDLLAVPAASLLAALIDWPMEPVMVDLLRYWRWLDRGPLFGVPLTNFTGWVLTAFLASWILSSHIPRGFEPQGVAVRAMKECRTALGWFCLFVVVQNCFLPEFNLGAFLASLALGIALLWPEKALVHADDEPVPSVGLRS